MLKRLGIATSILALASLFFPTQAFAENYHRGGDRGHEHYDRGRNDRHEFVEHRRYDNQEWREHNWGARYRSYYAPGYYAPGYYAPSYYGPNYCPPRTGVYFSLGL